MIFPTLRGQSFGYANVALYSREWLAGKAFDGNPLLDPLICQRMVDEMHGDLGVAWSYGGWLEDRSDLWDGSYLTDRRTTAHLGVDFNAPAGTPVSADVSLRCLLVDSDDPEPHGWGTRVIARVIGEPIVLIFGHLMSVRCVVGSTVEAGDIFAEVGTSDRNGGWHSHVHVQAVVAENDETFLQDLPFIDGYGDFGEIRDLSRVFPDPMRFVDIRSGAR